MGGSSLAPEVFAADVRQADGALRLLRARLDRPGRGAARRPPSSTSTTRCSSSPRSRAATIETLSHFAHFWSLRSTRVAASSPSPTRARRSSSWRPSTTVPGACSRTTRRHRRALLGALVLRAGAGRADGHRPPRPARPRGGRGSARTTARATADAPGRWLGAAMGEPRARPAATS